MMTLGKKRSLNRTSKYFNILSPELKNQKVSVFFRLQKDGQMFYSKDYQRARTRNSYTVMFLHNDSVQYGFILCFLQAEDYIYSVIKVLDVTEFKIDNGSWGEIQNHSLKKYRHKKLCPHLYPVKAVMAENLLVSAKCLLKKCVFIEIKDSKYISIPPNTSEHS